MNTLTRVLFIDQSGQLGGAELCLIDIAKAFSPGSEILLFQDGPFAELLGREKMPVSIYSLNAKAQSVGKKSNIGQSIRAIPALLGLMKKVSHKARTFDVIYANTAKALVVGAFASFFSSKPLVYHLHDMVNATHFSPSNRRLLVILSKWRARRVICNSIASLKAYQDAGGRQENCAVVYNGFRTETFSTDDQKVAAIRREQGCKEAPVALMAGRLTEWKGQHVFIEAVANVPGLHGWIVGEALFTDEDREYADGLKQLVKDKNVEDRIHFLGFRDDLPDLYYTADIIAHCSTSPEPFGRVIVEGMLCGKPVIATRHGGACEIINDGETGLLVTPDDSKALAEAFRQLLENPDYAGKLSSAGQKFATASFGLDQVNQQIHEVVQSALTA